jgi:hypothetical protein
MSCSVFATLLHLDMSEMRMKGDMIHIKFGEWSNTYFVINPLESMPFSHTHTHTETCYSAPATAGNISESFLLNYPHTTSLYVSNRVRPLPFYRLNLGNIQKTLGDRSGQQADCGTRECFHPSQNGGCRVMCGRVRCRDGASNRSAMSSVSSVGRPLSNVVRLLRKMMN